MSSLGLTTLNLTWPKRGWASRMLSDIVTKILHLQCTVHDHTRSRMRSRDGAARAD